MATRKTASTKHVSSKTSVDAAVESMEVVKNDESVDPTVRKQAQKFIQWVKQYQTKRPYKV